MAAQRLWLGWAIELEACSKEIAYSNYLDNHHRKRKEIAILRINNKRGGRVRDRATSLSGGKIRIDVAT